ncbi:thiamine phosphate synthase [Nocardioides nitrophenolicus]|uniref:thiamine phosphate synthase n=1 Tax=Nocardioides nitrophenolicus TaxID=60489 RepID=UPI00195C46D0|nr:thiamine phosphate synthase [Nocardioides nitrophenolicus]MBM7518860.1 thiamine-phosphate pyrophosphorylase [Nocardioides nitrophenolicus]
MTPHLFCLVSQRDDLSLLPALADAGVDGFQVRAKSLATGALVALARSVVAAVRPAGALVVVNDRLDVALAADADGVHLGADDLAVADARRLAPALLVGATCRSRAEVAAAADAGADYAGFGPVFASASKRGLPGPLGVPAVSEAAGVLPLVAIGGITAATAGEVRAAGAAGVAAIGAIWRQPDPLLAAKELVAAVG